MLPTPHDRFTTLPTTSHDALVRNITTADTARSTHKMRKPQKTLICLFTTVLMGTTLLSGCSSHDSTDTAAHSTTPSSTTVTSSPNASANSGASDTSSSSEEDTSDEADTTQPLDDTSTSPTDVSTPSHTSTPQRHLSPSPTAPEAPDAIQPGSILPQTHLDTKYAPLGVPDMSDPHASPLRPLVIVVSLTRQQTVQLHDKHTGEKISTIGSRLPLGGDALSQLGDALAGSSAFSSQHPNACVRTWVEISFTKWGTYATYVTGTECPARTKITAQLPGFSR